MSRVISDAVLEGRFIRSKKAEASGEAPAQRNVLEEAEIAEQQEQARAEAAAEAALARPVAAPAEADAPAAEEAAPAEAEEAAPSAGDEAPLSPDSNDPFPLRNSRNTDMSFTAKDVKASATPPAPA